MYNAQSEKIPEDKNHPKTIPAQRRFSASDFYVSQIKYQIAQ